jgi:hypothetical protein
MYKGMVENGGAARCPYCHHHMTVSCCSGLVFSEDYRLCRLLNFFEGILVLFICIKNTIEGKSGEWFFFGVLEKWMCLTGICVCDEQRRVIKYLRII